MKERTRKAKNFAQQPLYAPLLGEAPTLLGLASTGSAQVATFLLRLFPLIADSAQKKRRISAAGKM